MTRFTSRIRHLSLALMLSGAINIGVLSLLLYWMLTERPPTPYCELKPASVEQQQVPLADLRGCIEVLDQLSKLSFTQLVDRLSHTQLIENGYAERDLALACLTAFHHFDIQRALPKQSQQKRLISWKPKGIVLYPDLTEQQFEALIHFAKTERWPLTAEGLFLALKQHNQQDDLFETFVLTPEFWTVELLFNRSEPRVSQKELLAILLEGDWSLLKQFAEQQKQLHDSSDARRQKFILNYLKVGSSSAATLLLRTDWDFAIKKLDDQQVMAMINLMPTQLPQSSLFAKEMLVSPRSTQVWKRASDWLYRQADETPLKDWNYETVVARFFSEKLPSPISIIVSSPPKVETRPKSYTVQSGDSLWKIARQFGVKIEELKDYNELKSDILKPGIVLKIPLSR